MNGKMMKQQLCIFFMVLLFAEIVVSANNTNAKTTTTKTPSPTTSEYVIETWLYAVVILAFSVVVLTILAAALMYHWFWCPSKEEKEAAAAEEKARKKKMKKAKKPSKNAIVKEDEEEEEQEPPKPKKKASDSVNVKLQKKEEKQMPSSTAKPEKPEESNLEQQKQPTPKPKPKPKRTVTQIYSKAAKPPPFHQGDPEAVEDDKIQRTKTDQTPITGTLTTQDDSLKPTLQSITGSNKSFIQNSSKARPAVRLCPTRPINGPKKNIIINGKFDYHFDEPPKFQKTYMLAGNMPEWCTPPLTQYINFWSCIEHLTVVSRFSPVFVNPLIGPSNIFFMFRDLVAEEIKFSPYQILANRILEPLKNDAKSGNNNVDEKKKVYILRVYITCYAPLTMEIHCRGRCPLFLFSLFKCTKCSSQLERYQFNDWLIPSEEGNERWENFVCRIKRIPVNSHQVFCYNGPKQKPDNCDEVNHIFVIRGDFKSTNICPCTRYCSYTYHTHLNSFKLKPARLPWTSTKADV